MRVAHWKPLQRTSASGGAGAAVRGGERGRTASAAVRRRATVADDGGRDHERRASVARPPHGPTGGASVPAPYPPRSRSVTSASMAVPLDHDRNAAVPAHGARAPRRRGVEGRRHRRRATATKGVHTVLVCCTGGEAGDILNPAVDTPEVRANLYAVRMQELQNSGGRDRVLDRAPARLPRLRHARHRGQRPARQLRQRTARRSGRAARAASSAPSDRR